MARTLRLCPKGACDERNIAIMQERRASEQKVGIPRNRKEANNESSVGRSLTNSFQDFTHSG
jgi:hypothetical protein